MDKTWTVVANTGKRMDLECGLEKKEVRCPTDATGKKIFLGLRPGQSVDDNTLRHFLKVI